MNTIPGQPTPDKERIERRNTLLLKMYDQMFNDINTHILVVWQSVGVLIGAFAIFALTEKKIITLDVAVTLIIVLVGWLVAHLYDAAYWYNRNLVIIANIERQFLLSTDLKDIHYYFGRHRPDNKMITHLTIQYALGVGIGFAMILFHAFTSLIPSIQANTLSTSYPIWSPYIAVVIVIIFLAWLKGQRNESYQEFLKNSPGIELDTSNISYGTGHGFPEN